MSKKRIVCLVPARNAELLLPQFFRTISPITDLVVALDDGSTDGTAGILNSHSSVKVLLKNPTKSDFSSWDDGKNRADLLHAAESLNPDWILYLDADESMSESDAILLRKFINSEAREYAAYGFQVHRMINDKGHFDKNDFWAYRLFHYRTGLRLSPIRLHSLTVPIDIPKRNYLKTPFRIQHFSSLTHADRLLRYEKYQESDPHGDFQTSYSNLLDSPTNVKPWKDAIDPEISDALSSRHKQLDKLYVDRFYFPEHRQNDPLISAIVISQNDANVIRKVIQALLNQTLSPELYEIILVNSGNDDTCDIVTQEFKTVKVLKLEQPALPGKARNDGLKIARGYYISFPGSHVVLPSDSLEHRLQAHLSGFEMITGVTLNGNRLITGWASYFMDHHQSLPSIPSKVLEHPPAHCSYMSGPLLEVNGFPEHRRTGEDTHVNMKLFDKGYRAYRHNQLRFTHNSPCSSILVLIKHHYKRGLGFGRIIGEKNPYRIRALYILYLTFVYPFHRMARISYSVAKFGRPYINDYIKSSPLIFLGILSAGAGAISHLIRKSL